ncbi:HIT family protein [Planomicrobium sp. Y74]|uniref:HIT family protein n=1 Tax=Planomicrobium sp. Y74 TaxID=2478977 RepID=UPI000EF528CE|nr:HIT family protein [Planomicrobium sp. Y74]RLQ91279.1 HIT family protein [Planomicrobium sp. Y74]
MEKIEECLGCKLANNELETQVVYENEWITCILDHDPFNEGHVLILPKRHYRFIDEFDTETALSVMKAAQLLSSAIKIAYQPDGISICQNGGTFDDLTHFHMHIVPRQENQDFSSFYTDEVWDNEAIKERLPETRERLAKYIAEDVFG